MKYRKKPVVIEAYQLPLEGDPVGEKQEDELITFLRSAPKGMIRTDHTGVFIRTLEGEMRADPGDWIIKGMEGEFYPCKPSVFEATYEPAKMLTENRRFRIALESIAANTCCDKCQEAALVAKDALSNA